MSLNRAPFTILKLEGREEEGPKTQLVTFLQFLPSRKDDLFLLKTMFSSFLELFRVGSFQINALYTHKVCQFNSKNTSAKMYFLKYTLMTIVAFDTPS